MGVEFQMVIGYWLLFFTFIYGTGVFYIIIAERQKHRNTGSLEVLICRTDIQPNIIYESSNFQVPCLSVSVPGRRTDRQRLSRLLDIWLDTGGANILQIIQGDIHIYISDDVMCDVSPTTCNMAHVTFLLTTTLCSFSCYRS